MRICDLHLMRYLNLNHLLHFNFCIYFFTFKKIFSNKKPNTYIIFFSIGGTYFRLDEMRDDRLRLKYTDK